MLKQVSDDFHKSVRASLFFIPITVKSTVAVSYTHLKKFVYGLVREGARAKDFETAILWLSDCGLVHKISRVNAGGIPLKAYEDLKAFKLFLVDVGLLGCMAGLCQRTLLDGNDLFIEFKGALTAVSYTHLDDDIVQRILDTIQSV